LWLQEEDLIPGGVSKGDTFEWEGQEWTVIDVCSDRDNRATGWLLCSPNPESEQEPDFWEVEDVVKLKSN
jgi:hypothetical protein